MSGVATSRRDVVFREIVEAPTDKVFWNWAANQGWAIGKLRPSTPREPRPDLLPGIHHVIPGDGGSLFQVWRDSWLGEDYL